MAPTADDYRWTGTWRNGLLRNAYCLALVKELSAAEVLDRLGADQRHDGLTLDDVSEHSWRTWDEHAGSRLFVGVAELDGWSVMFEDNGFVGITLDLMRPVSGATAVVSHLRNVNALDQFLWLVRNEVLLRFEPLFPTAREGAWADESLPELLAVGFPMGDPDFATWSPTAGAFALADRITGVAITGELLDGATYRGGTIRVRPTD